MIPKKTMGRGISIPHFFIENPPYDAVRRVFNQE
jgi:hypothetical protein